MMSLFSQFDMIYSSLKFVIILIPIIVMTNELFIISTKKSVCFYANYAMMGFFWSLKPMNFNKIIMASMITIMFLIFTLNFTSIMPYIFPMTSQMSLILATAMSLWGAMMIFKLINSPKGFLSHLIPEGAPIILCIFLIVIEMVSSMIRPITLAVRLMSNILSGHLLMTLLSLMALNMPPFTMLYLALNIVELFVALIQSFIFITLIGLYYSEV